MENVLENTRTYLVGHMQYASGRDWRKYVEEELEKLNIVTFNPYRKPFVKDVEEDEGARQKMAEDMASGYYNDVAERMRTVRNYDLNLVDRSDFIIAHILPDIASWGSAEELVTAVRAIRAPDSFALFRSSRFLKGKFLCRFPLERFLILLCADGGIGHA